MYFSSVSAVHWSRDIATKRLFLQLFLPETAPVVSPSTVFAPSRLLLTVLGHELILLSANAAQDAKTTGLFLCLPVWGSVGYFNDFKNKYWQEKPLFPGGIRGDYRWNHSNHNCWQIHIIIILLSHTQEGLCNLVQSIQSAVTRPLGKKREPLVVDYSEILHQEGSGVIHSHGDDEPLPQSILNVKRDIWVVRTPCLLVTWEQGD